MCLDFLEYFVKYIKSRLLNHSSMYALLYVNSLDKPYYIPTEKLGSPIIKLL